MMTLSAMVARPTGRNWVRTDRFGEWLKAFLCARPPSITVLLTSITNGWSCGPANRREDAKVLSNAERQRRYIARSGRPPQAATHFGMR